MFAKAMGAELALPPVVHRTAFNASTSWHTAPAASLFDVDAITDYWSSRDVFMHTVRGHIPCKVCGIFEAGNFVTAG